MATTLQAPNSMPGNTTPPFLLLPCLDCQTLIPGTCPSLEIWPWQCEQGACSEHACCPHLCHLLFEVRDGLLAGGLSCSEQAQTQARRALATLGTWPQGDGVSLKRVLRWVGDGRKQWSCSACTAPVVAPRKRRVGGEEQSRRPPWEEEMDEATSLDPQEFQALA